MYNKLCEGKIINLRKVKGAHYYFMMDAFNFYFFIKNIELVTILFRTKVTPMLIKTIAST